MSPVIRDCRLCEAGSLRLGFKFLPVAGVPVQKRSAPPLVHIAPIYSGPLQPEVVGFNAVILRNLFRR